MGRLPDAAVTEDSSTGELAGALSAVLPGSKFWLTEAARLAMGDECMSIQGFPLHLVDPIEVAKTSNATKSDLAGNSFNGGSFLT
eukprot:1104516-Alexandrium_andersonii.AAC.1